jgi:hypothetical protein
MGTNRVVSVALLSISSVIPLLLGCGGGGEDYVVISERVYQALRANRG